MDVSELRRAHRARPFRTFRICLADGREIPVTHPENLVVTSDGRTAAVYVPREGTEILDLPLMTALDFRRKRSEGGRGLRPDGQAGGAVQPRQF